VQQVGRGVIPLRVSPSVGWNTRPGGAEVKGSLEAAYRGRGLSVLGVSTDLGRDLSAVEKFLASYKPGFPNYHKAKGGDDQDFIDAVDKSWGGELPFTVLYDRAGRKAQVLSGKHSYAELEREVGKLLK